MAYVLKRDKQILCLKVLVEGSSLRATERTVGVHRDTVMRLMVRFGEGCQQLLSRTMHGLKLRHLEIDEQWSWVGKKQGRLTEAEKSNPELGDQYLFLAIDQDTKLVPTYFIGKRNEESTRTFIDDLAERIVLPKSVNDPMQEKPQLSTDGWASYVPAIGDAFGSYAQHGVIIKNYANPEVGRYAPPDITKCDRRRVQFIENLWTICTSHVERFNCTTRQFVKRFCRLTLAFSKKLRNLKAAVAMHLARYNFVWRPRKPGNTSKRRPTPAMAAGVVDTLWSFDDLYDIVMDGRHISV